MPHRRHLRAAPALALLLAAATLSGCSKDAGVLARVGSATITTDDFNTAAKGNFGSYPGNADSAKAHLLDDLVRREIMVQGAIGRGLHRDTLFLDYRQHIEDQILRERLFSALNGGAGVAVSEAEIAELYRWRGDETRLGVIYSYERSMARAARAELDAGRPFAEVAQRYNPAGVLPPGGDLGFVPPGSMIQPVDSVLRVAPAGAIVGPIEAPGQGWFVLRIMERRKREQPPLATQHDQLAEMLRQRKQRALLSHAVERLVREYEVRVEDGAPQRLVLRLTPPPADNPFTLPPVPTLQPAEQAIVLARWRGGAYTMGDAAADLGNPEQPRPNFLVLPTVTRWIEGQAIERAARIEARRRRLQDEPDIQRMVRERGNNRLLDAFYAREVLYRVSVTPDEVRARLAAHAGALVRLEGVTLSTARFPDSAAAGALAQHAGHAGTLAAAAAMAAPGLRVTTERVRFPNDDPFWSGQKPRFTRMAPGEFAGPLRAPKGWIVFQLMAKDESHPTFEQLTAPERQQLESEALEIAREVRLNALTDSLRGHVPVRVWRERLARLPWPMPTSTPSPQG